MSGEKKQRNMGPVLAGTLVTAELERTVGQYVNWLEMSVADAAPVSEAQAALWGMPALAGARQCLLASRAGARWLRVIEQAGCPVAKPIGSHGWMSLEVLVEEVDGLAARLGQSPFRFIGAPANLDVSDNIRACQVVGPTGEVLYLTSVKGPVPPFELPTARCAVDRLFIPVLAVPSRAEAQAFYERANAATGLAFDTKVTVINNALGKPVDRRIPVATVQLEGESLIEIDQVDEFGPREALPSGLVPGIAVVSFLVRSLEQVPGQPLGEPRVIDGAFYEGRRAALYRGAGGELVEFIEA